MLPKYKFVVDYPLALVKIISMVLTLHLLFFSSTRWSRSVPSNFAALFPSSILISDFGLPSLHCLKYRGSYLRLLYLHLVTQQGPLKSRSSLYEHSQAANSCGIFNDIKICVVKAHCDIQLRQEKCFPNTLHTNHVFEYPKECNSTI